MLWIAANLWQVTHLSKHPDGNMQHSTADAGSACVLFRCAFCITFRLQMTLTHEQCQLTEC